MPDIDQGGRDLSTEQSRLVKHVTTALFSHDIDESLRILGRYMDKHDLRVSRKVIDEFEFADRVSDA